MYTYFMEVMNRKNRNKRYGWLLMVMLINWIAIVMVVYFIDPEIMRDVLFPNSYLPMILLLSLGLFWPFSIIFMSAKRAIRWTVGAVFFIYLRIWGMGTLLNAILIFGLLGSLEAYWWKTKNIERGVAHMEKKE